MLRHTYKSLASLFLASALFVCSSLFMPSSEAATQGSQGPTSSGTVETVVTIGQFVRIRNLRDFIFGIWNVGDGTLSDNDNACIANNAIFGSYAVRATGDGNGFDPAAFTLSNGAEQINYNVYWNDQTGTAGNQQLTAGLIQHGQTASAFSFLFNVFGFCVLNSNLEIEIPDTELQAASGGTYSGTLTLLIIPD